MALHCDVGGSYIEGRPEGVTPNVTPDPDGLHILAQDSTSGNINTSTKLENLKQLLQHEGWFNENQINIDREELSGDTSSTNLFKLVTNRAYISNQYSFIPLHLMCQLAIDRDLPFNMKNLKDIKDFSSNPISEHLALMQRVKVALNHYANEVIADPTGEHEYRISEADIKQLRNNYLHYNAVVGLVNAPEKDRKRAIITP